MRCFINSRKGFSIFILNFFRSLFLLTLIGLQTKAQTYGNYSISIDNFAELYNKYRVAQPRSTPWISNYFPYGDNGTAILLDAGGTPDIKGQSPMAAYNFLDPADSEKNAETWESENHTCSKLTGKDLEGCRSWWGHCNGWAAAAIKDPEPRMSIPWNGRNFTVAEQKGILSELWLSSESLFAGETHKSRPTSNWVTNPQDPSFNSFWDVTPRTFFMVFTNYIGALETGLAIDRFTGDEVWNQPIVGYRHLPIRSSDIEEIKRNGKSIWSVTIRTKIYWANDEGIPYGKISTPFDIFKHTTDSEIVEQPHELPGQNEYEGRLLKYKIFLDAPLELNPTGTQVKSQGHLIGEGLWSHQEQLGQTFDNPGTADKFNLNAYQIEILNNSHPDFIWLPTNPYRDIYNGYGNPFIRKSVVDQLYGTNSLQYTRPDKFSKSNKSTSISKNKANNLFEIQLPKIAFESPALKGLDPADISRKIRRSFLREGAHINLRKSDIQVRDQLLILKINFPNMESIEDISSMLQDMGFNPIVAKVDN